MSYQKLSEVSLVEEVSEDTNLLVEENGDIKRVPVDGIALPQVRADWNEEDINSPAFILNKPKSSGGANIVTYILDSDALMHKDGAPVTAQDIVDAWNSGSILRLNIVTGASDSYELSSIIAVHYTKSSGSLSANITYLRGTNVADKYI